MPISQGCPPAAPLATQARAGHPACPSGNSDPSWPLHPEVSLHEGGSRVTHSLSSNSGETLEAILRLLPQAQGSSFCQHSSVFYDLDGPASCRVLVLVIDLFYGEGNREVRSSKTFVLMSPAPFSGPSLPFGTCWALNSTLKRNSKRTPDMSPLSRGGCEERTRVPARHLGTPSHTSWGRHRRLASTELEGVRGNLSGCK